MLFFKKDFPLHVSIFFLFLSFLFDVLFYFLSSFFYYFLSFFLLKIGKMAFWRLRQWLSLTIDKSLNISLVKKNVFDRFVVAIRNS